MATRDTGILCQRHQANQQHWKRDPTVVSDQEVLRPRGRCAHVALRSHPRQLRALRGQDGRLLAARRRRGPKFVPAAYGLLHVDVSLDLNLTTSPITIHRFSSWVERNNLPRWSYIIFDDAATIVSPPQICAGAYRLYYTPCCSSPLAFRSATPTPNDGDAVDGTLKNWFFVNGAFDSTYVGATMTAVAALTRKATTAPSRLRR